MSKYMSLIFLYEKTGKKKMLIAYLFVPICFLAAFLARVGPPAEAAPIMLVERGFMGIWDVAVFVAAILIMYYFLVSGLNGKKALKASHSTTGYTIRRLGISPTASYLTILVYFLVIILTLWAIGILSIFLIGKGALAMCGAKGIYTKIAMGFLRTEIGAALVPFGNPLIAAFNVAAVTGLAAECAKSCYLGWHNGSPSAGVLLIAAAMFITWSFGLSAGYLIIIIIIIGAYAAFSVLDVVFREKRPKGDPFRVNKYSGIIDTDSVDFEEDVFLQTNTGAEAYDIREKDKSILDKYGGIDGNEKKKVFRGINIWSQRQRYMPIGSNMEKANYLFGFCICIGIGEHLLFLTRFGMHMREIMIHIKGEMLDSEYLMPYFRELQSHTLYGYLAAVLLVVSVQAYWNYAYYNKETNSVYVMKRLRDRKEYPRTIWVSPVIEAIIIILIMMVSLVSDLVIYALVTPDAALHADWMSHILPAWRLL